MSAHQDPINVGDKFELLTVAQLGPHYVSPNGNKQRQWYCDCKCGKRVLVLQGSLRRHATTSCGCKSKLKRIKFEGKKYTLNELSAHTEIPYASLYLRIVKQKQDPDKAIEELRAKKNVVTKRGSRYGKLRVRKPGKPNKQGLPRWKCRCDCGNKTTVLQALLRNGHTISCGCEQKRSATKHGLSRHKLYSTCNGAIQRCHNRKATNYQHYGARGIKVYKAWRKDIGAFIEWVEANLGPKPRGKTLDRIDNEKGYRPGNLRWATSRVQCGNRRSSLSFTYKGRTRTLAEWCEKFGIDYNRAHHRIFVKGLGFREVVSKR